MSLILLSTSVSLQKKNLDLLACSKHIDLCKSVLKDLAEADFPSIYGKAVQAAENVGTLTSISKRGCKSFSSSDTSLFRNTLSFPCTSSS